jgi:NADH:flavin oxidoreductase / NADH oxidase family/Pyridine nucleotide-disulphide oxidoreductase
MSAPSAVPPGEYPGALMPKELEEREILQILDSYGSAAQRAAAAGLDGVEFHMAHGYLPWQFLSPLYNLRTDGWGGSYENRLRFSLDAMTRIRQAIGEDMLLGYRINSTSFWEGDLEPDDLKEIVADFDRQLDVDYVSLSAGVHHSYIHTPMDYEEGWEREYTRAIKQITKKPVLLVGRYNTPGGAEVALVENDADAILLARQMFAEPEWVNKATQGREDDIRRCVAANFCWRSVTRGGRVQCVYNPELGRERAWGAGTLERPAAARKVLVIGGGPAGLEYARVASAIGHDVVLYESDEVTGGHTRAYGALPHRSEYARIGRWLTDQAVKNGTIVHTFSHVEAGNLDELLAGERPVQLLTRWPMVAMDTVGDVYLHWMLTYLYQSGVEMLTDHFVKEIRGDRVEVFNVYMPSVTRELTVDAIVMATGRASENQLYSVLKARGASVEMIGDAVAPPGHVRGDLRGAPSGAQADHDRAGRAVSLATAQRARSEIRAWPAPPRAPTSAVRKRSTFARLISS